MSLAAYASSMFTEDELRVLREWRDGRACECSAGNFYVHDGLTGRSIVLPSPHGPGAGMVVSVPHHRCRMRVRLDGVTRTIVVEGRAARLGCEACLPQPTLKPSEPGAEAD